jgi:hypothetical protein
VIADHPVSIQQPGAPVLTLTAPAGWTAREHETTLVLTRGRLRVVVRQCALLRSERDMTGRHGTRVGRQLAPGVYGSSKAVAVAVRGGTCLSATGPGAATLAPKLHPRLGPAKPPPASDAAAEQLARAARKRTLGEARATGTATAVIKRARISSTWQWDLAAKYFHQLQRFGSITAEVLRRPDGDYLRGDDIYEACWGGTSSAKQDDALEPRLELQEWDAPPSTKTAWRVSYAPAETLPDGTTRLRWTGFVADGEAIVGVDGRLRSVQIADHGQARGRTAWSAVRVEFTGFPAALTPVVPEPRCSGST